MRASDAASDGQDVYLSGSRGAQPPASVVRQAPERGRWRPRL